jgi:hypothetical protein
MTEQNEENERKLKPEILYENDIPFDDMPSGDKALSNPKQVSGAVVKRLSEADAKGIERKPKLFNLTLNNWTFKLLTACFILFVVTYAVDVLLLNSGLENSSMTDTFFDFLKYIITTLIGFLFASKVNKRDD